MVLYSFKSKYIAYDTIYNNINWDTLKLLPQESGVTIDKLSRMILQRQQEDLKNLELCARLYTWEEKVGLPHPHTLIEVSQIFDVRYQDVLEVYSRMSEEQELEKTRRILEETARKL